MAFGFGFGFKFGSSEKKTAKSESILCDAITQKACVTASYKGGAIHLLEPYALYRGPNGELLLSAVRVDGPSSSHSNHEKLETFEVAQLSFLELSQQSFSPDPRFDPKSLQNQDNIVCTVQAA